MRIPSSFLMSSQPPDFLPFPLGFTQRISDGEGADQAFSYFRHFFLHRSTSEWRFLSMFTNLNPAQWNLLSANFLLSKKEPQGDSPNSLKKKRKEKPAAFWNACRLSFLEEYTVDIFTAVTSCRQLMKITDFFTLKLFKL